MASVESFIGFFIFGGISALCWFFKDIIKDYEDIDEKVFILLKGWAVPWGIAAIAVLLEGFNVVRVMGHTVGQVLFTAIILYFFIGLIGIEFISSFDRKREVPKNYTFRNSYPFMLINKGFKWLVSKIINPNRRINQQHVYAPCAFRIDYLPTLICHEAFELVFACTVVSVDLTLLRQWLSSSINRLRT